jgi:hypothetical protein
LLTYLLYLKVGKDVTISEVLVFYSMVILEHTKFEVITMTVNIRNVY